MVLDLNTAEYAPTVDAFRAAPEVAEVVTTETGELREGRPSSSYRNILRAGFREAGVRANYRAP